jgi:hypothetical protein
MYILDEFLNGRRENLSFWTCELALIGGESFYSLCAFSLLEFAGSKSAWLQRIRVSHG